MRRRELVLAAAAAFAARPAAAAAAESEGEILDRLVLREEAAAIAYRSKGLALEAGHAADHAAALRTQIQALGRKGPLPPERSELDAAARRLADADADAAPARTIALERSLLAEYEDALRSLHEPSILRTAATIAAGHAQHHALLRREAGLDPHG